ncbi:MAG: hypothetical protein V7717_00205 [Porticoccaceae bacterium]
MKTQKSPVTAGQFRNKSTNMLSSNQLNQSDCSLRIGGGGSPRPRRRETKYERSCILMISTPGGVTENDILRACRLSSGRNYPNKLEKEAGIIMGRARELNPDGIGSHFRYRIRSANDAQQAIKVVNKLSIRRGAGPLTDEQVRRLLALYNTDDE